MPFTFQWENTESDFTVILSQYSQVWLSHLLELCSIMMPLLCLSRWLRAATWAVLMRKWVGKVSVLLRRGTPSRVGEPLTTQLCWLYCWIKWQPPLPHQGSHPELSDPPQSAHQLTQSADPSLTGSPKHQLQLPSEREALSHYLWSN